MTPPSIILYSASGYHRQLWKNGQGMTTEIAKYNDPDRDDDFIWRLSIADITEDGPFSVFSGIDRTLMLLDGNGIDLSFNQEKINHRLQDLYSILSFDGADEIDCKLIEGPTRDFNVMTRRNAVRHEIQVMTTISNPQIIKTKDEILLIFCMDEILNVEIANTIYALTNEDTLQINVPRETSVQISSAKKARYALIHIIAD